LIPASIKQEAKVWVEEFHNFLARHIGGERGDEFWPPPPPLGSVRSKRAAGAIKQTTHQTNNGAMQISVRSFVCS